MTTKATRLTIDVSPDFRNELKMQAIEQGKTIKQYVMEAVMQKMQREIEQEEEILWQRVQEAKKEGFIGRKASAELLKNMKECLKNA